MSGGSWNYLYRKAESGELPNEAELLAAEKRLIELGDKESAYKVALAGYLVKLATEQLKGVEEALHDMEWVDSGDYDVEQFRQQMLRRQKR